MAKEFQQKGWGRGEPARRGGKKGNQAQRSKKRLTQDDSNTISKEEVSMPKQAQAKPKEEVTGPVFYRCLSDPGDVKQRNPGQPVPFCRYCGFRMVVVGMLGREKRERM